MDKRIATFGDVLRDWRKRRRLTQMELAFRANVSARHLGFVEVGRAAPGRALVMRLSVELDLPLRERNAWLILAGFAPVYTDYPYEHPQFDVVREAIEMTLNAHRPFPAFALDRGYNVVASNAALPELFDGVSPSLLTPPINTMRLSLHPRGLAPRITNFPEWSEHLVEQIRRDLDVSGDRRLVALLEEIDGYGLPKPRRKAGRAPAPSVVLPVRIRTALGELAFFSTMTVFGTPTDVTLAEVAIEALFPADAATRAIVLHAAGALPAR